MLKIFKHMRKDTWMLLLLSVLVVIAQVWIDLRIPDYMTTITILVKTEGSPMSEIWRAGLMMLVCAVLAMCLSLLSGYVSARLAALFSRDLRSDIFNAVENFSLEEIDRFSTASLITRSTNDVTQIQNFMSRGLRMIINTPITVTIAMIKIWGKSWQWTSLLGAGVVDRKSVV